MLKNIFNKFFKREKKKVYFIEWSFGSHRSTTYTNYIRGYNEVHAWRRLCRLQCDNALYLIDIQEIKNKGE